MNNNNINRKVTVPSKRSAKRQQAVGTTSVVASALSTSDIYSILKLQFSPSGSITKQWLETATNPSGVFMAYLRNELPKGIFPDTGGSVQQCTGGSTCAGTVYVVTQPITNCAVDVCFLMDGSGSIASYSGAWQVEANVVDGITRTIGEWKRYAPLLEEKCCCPLSLTHLHMVFAGAADANIAVVEFANGQTSTLVPPTPKATVDTSLLRNLAACSGCLTPMHLGISKCQQLLLSDPVMQATNNHGKVIVLLTDGWPDDSGSATSVANTAKAAGIKIVTVAVGTADTIYMSTLSSGNGFNFSAAAFNNDATNLGIQVSPVVCASGELFDCSQRGISLDCQS